jgi:hypothetical protein
MIEVIKTFDKETEQKYIAISPNSKLFALEKENNIMIF